MWLINGSTGFLPTSWPLGSFHYAIATAAPVVTSSSGLAWQGRWERIPPHACFPGSGIALSPTHSGAHARARLSQRAASDLLGDLWATRLFCFWFCFGGFCLLAYLFALFWKRWWEYCLWKPSLLIRQRGGLWLLLCSCESAVFWKRNLMHCTNEMVRLAERENRETVS